MNRCDGKYLYWASLFCLEGDRSVLLPLKHLLPGISTYPETTHPWVPSPKIHPRYLFPSLHSYELYKSPITSTSNCGSTLFTSFLEFSLHPDTKDVSGSMNIVGYLIHYTDVKWVLHPLRVWTLIWTGSRVSSIHRRTRT